EAELAFAVRERPLEHRTEVRELREDDLDVLVSLRLDREPGRFREGKEEVRMPREGRRGVVRCLEPLDREFEDGLEHPKATVVQAPEEALLDERPNRPQVGVTDRLGRLDGE